MASTMQTMQAARVVPAAPLLSATPASLCRATRPCPRSKAQNVDKQTFFPPAQFERSVETPPFPAQCCEHVVIGSAHRWRINHLTGQTYASFMRRCAQTREIRPLRPGDVAPYDGARRSENPAERRADGRCCRLFQACRRSFARSGT